MPALSVLQENEFFLSFCQSEQQSTYWLRTSHMPGIYNNNRYDSEAGMYTFITRVMNGEDTVGYFFLDFNPFRILNSFFDYSRVDGYQDCTVYFSTDNKSLRSDAFGLVNESRYVPQSKKTDRQGNTLYIVSDLPARNSYAIAALPLTSLNNSILLIVGITLVSGVVCVLLTYIIARIAVRRMLKPLTDLTKDLENTKNQNSVPLP